MKKHFTQTYQPKEQEIFWCNNCDAHKVDSLDSDTGNFFIRYGHSYSSKTKRFDGEYTGVMYAICNHCG